MTNNIKIIWFFEFYPMAGFYKFSNFWTPIEQLDSQMTCLAFGDKILMWGLHRCKIFVSWNALLINLNLNNKTA